MNSIKKFDDKSSLSWKDKETLEYAERDYTLLVWVDFMPGFFSSGRVLKLDSLCKWTSSPKGSEALISNEKKEEIIGKVISYYKDHNKKCITE